MVAPGTHDAYQGSSLDRDKNAKRVTLMGPSPAGGPGHHQYQHAQDQHIPLLPTHEYRPQSALILTQDNTPSSSRITTSSVTTRTSSTPEPSRAHPHDRGLVATTTTTTTTTASAAVVVPGGGALNINTIDPTTQSYSYDGPSHPVQSNGHASSSSSSAPPPPQNPDPLSSVPNGDASEDPSRVKPRRVLGNYHMSKTLGAGSMGKVKLGVHSRTRDK
ncbi:hypothetical protein BG005_000447, partial [Podila minutissima]